MGEEAKRRLIGAAILVVLLVIFLPMLLEEETLPPQLERDLSIPPRPDFDQGHETPVPERPVESPVSGFQEYGEGLEEGSPPSRELPRPDFGRDHDAAISEGLIEPPVSTFQEYEEPAPDESSPSQELPPPEFPDMPALTEPEGAAVPVDEASPAMGRTPESKAPAAKPALTPEKKKKTPPAPKPAPTPEKKKKTPPAPKPEPTPEATPAPEEKSPPKAESAPASRWVIQVASLREHERAYSLVQDLRAKGFPAYIEEAQVKESKWHRVRVGPETGRDRIESMAASLRAKMGLKGLIQRYP